MADQAALLSALRSFAVRSVEDYVLGDVLDEVNRHALGVLGLDGAGITLSVAGAGQRTQYISATDGNTLHVEREQDRLKEGACVEAINKGSPVHVSDVTTLDRWPNYRPVVLGAGFRSVAGIPMLAAQRVVGAMNAYTASPRAWSEGDVQAALLLANMATAYISNATGYADKARLASQLQHALDSRVIIEQAKGVIAERYGVSMEQAFEALRRHARNQRAKIHEISEDVLTNRQTVEP